MAYFDPTDEPELQILNRLRDLLESDNLVRASNRYPEPKKIYSLQSESVSHDDNIRVSLVVAQGDVAPSATSTNATMPMLCLVVQKFCSTIKTGTEEEELAFKACANVTFRIMLAIVSRYQSDPTPLPDSATERLWDSMTFPGSSRFDSDAKGFYYSLTYIRPFRSQRNR